MGLAQYCSCVRYCKGSNSGTCQPSGSDELWQAVGRPPGRTVKPPTGRPVSRGMPIDPSLNCHVTRKIVTKSIRTARPRTVTPTHLGLYIVQAIPSTVAPTANTNPW